MNKLVFVVPLAACASSPNAIDVALAPSLISDLDGTTEVSAILVRDTTPVDGVAAHLAVTYTDRNGTAHAIAPIDGKSDARGIFHATLTGLSWEGTGTVTVTTVGATGSATFAVLDRSPPKVTILPPTTDLHVGPGLPLDVQVHVTDEIGVSQVTFDDGQNGPRTTIVASGAMDATLTFRTDIPQGAQPGPTIVLHALASDLSGNLAAAAPVTLIVDPSITIATPPPLAGTLLVAGTMQQLVDPRAIVASAMDGHLYVADQANVGACTPSCVWRVDAATGAIDATPVVVGQGNIEGVAVDATSANLYYTDSQNRTGRLTWNGTAYASAVQCDDPTQQLPQNPFHVVFDATLGLLTPDGNAQNVVRVATCATTTAGSLFTTGPNNFDQPRGIAAGAAGEFYVSDIARDRISKMTNTGALTTFERGIAAPYGMKWLGASATQFANSLMVASQGDRIVASTTGNGPLAAVYLTQAPIDLAFIGGTMYVLTTPQGGPINRARIYKVTGF